MNGLVNQPYIKTEKRHTLDLYLTPPGLAYKMALHGIGMVDSITYSNGRPLRVLDLGSGPGVFGLVCKLILGWRDIPHEIIGVEINPANVNSVGYDVVHTRDVLQDDLSDLGHFDLVIMNPPFVHAEHFVRTAISCCKDHGNVVALLPNTFEFAATRGDFFNSHNFKERFVLEDRPGFYYALLHDPDYKALFTANKKLRKDKYSMKGTDAQHYCVYVFDARPRRNMNRWSWGYDEDGGALEILEGTTQLAPYALVFEAAQAQEGELVWDDIGSQLAARVLGKEFVSADDSTRAKLRQEVLERMRNA